MLGKGVIEFLGVGSKQRCRLCALRWSFHLRPGAAVTRQLEASYSRPGAETAVDDDDDGDDDDGNDDDDGDDDDEDYDDNDDDGDDDDADDDDDDDDVKKAKTTP